MINLTNKVAVVAGAGGGIGSVVVKQLFDLGAKAVLLDTNEENLKKVEEGLGKNPERVFLSLCDATNEEALIKAKEEVLEKWGEIDILVNCIGAPAAAEKTEELSLENWKKIVDTDLGAAFLLCKTFGAEMIKKKHGRIVNFTSFHTAATYPNRAAYNAAKSAVKGLTRALAVEWGSYGITVNAVAPGPIITPRTSWFLSQSPDVEEGMLGRTPNVRLGQPKDVAALVAFLVSDQALHINGQEIVIDGGWTKCAWWGKHEKK